jgi:hypothetical protein
MIVSLLYRVGAGGEFDLDYYLAKHIPLMGIVTLTPSGWTRRQGRNAAVTRQLAARMSPDARH